MLGLQAAALRTQLEDVQAWRVVDEERRLAQLATTRVQLLVFVFLQVALPEFVAVDFRFRRDQTLHKLHRRHLQAEHGHRNVVVHRHVAGHRQHEGRLAHAGTCREHNHVRPLPTARDFVQVVESRRHPTHAVLVVPSGLDVVQRLTHDGAHALVALADVAFRHLKQLRLRLVQQVKHVRRLVVRLLNDRVGHPNQFPLDVLLRDDAGVEFHVGAARHTGRQRRHAVAAAEHVQFPFLAQLLGDREQVNGLGVVEQRLDGAEHLAVRFHVKTLRLKHVDDRVDRGLLDHHGPQHHLLQLLRLRLNLGTRNGWNASAHQVSGTVGRGRALG